MRCEPNAVALLNLHSDLFYIALSLEHSVSDCERCALEAACSMCSRTHACLLLSVSEGVMKRLPVLWMCAGGSCLRSASVGAGIQAL